MEFVITEVVADEPLSASEYNSWDLAVNGLSFLWVTLTGLQAADNVETQIDDLLAALDLVCISYNGQNICAGRGREVARLGGLICGVPPWRTHAAEAANAEAGVSFFIPFGRRLFDPTEGFPAVQRGQLQVQVTAAASFGDALSPEIGIYQCELPGARFARYNKFTTRTLTPAATGYLDVPLPIGNLLRGVMVRSTTRWRNLNVAGTVKSILLMGNNTEHYFTGGQQGLPLHLAMYRGGQGVLLNEAALMSDIGAAYAQFQSTRGIPVATNEFMANYSYLDLDFLKDDSTSWDTKGLADCSCRLDVATSGEEVRVLAYESVATAGTGR